MVFGLANVPLPGKVYYLLVQGVKASHEERGEGDDISSYCFALREPIEDHQVEEQRDECAKLDDNDAGQSHLRVADAEEYTIRLRVHGVVTM